MGGGPSDDGLTLATLPVSCDRWRMGSERTSTTAAELSAAAEAIGNYHGRVGDLARRHLASRS